MMSTSTSVSCPYVKICLFVIFILETGLASPLDQSITQSKQHQQLNSISSINSSPSASANGYVSKVVTPSLPHFESSNQPTDVHLMEESNDFRQKSIENEYSPHSSHSKVESHLANLLGCTSLSSSDLTTLLATQPIILSNALQLYMDQNGFDKTKILLAAALGDKGISIVLHSTHMNDVTATDSVSSAIDTQPQQVSSENVVNTSDEVVADEIDEDEQQQHQLQVQRHQQQQQLQKQLPEESTEQMDVNSLRVTSPSDSSSEELPLQISPVSSQADLRLIDIPVNLNGGANSHSRVDGSKESTGSKVFDHSPRLPLLPHKDDASFFFIPRMRMMPFGSRVKVVARNKILTEMKIPVTPYMGVFEALKQIENRVTGSKHVNSRSSWIEFALALKDDDENHACYAIHRIGKLSQDQSHYWNIRVINESGDVSHDDECIPSDKSVRIVPSSTVELLYTPRMRSLNDSSN